MQRRSRRFTGSRGAGAQGREERPFARGEARRTDGDARRLQIATRHSEPLAGAILRARRLALGLRGRSMAAEVVARDVTAGGAEVARQERTLEFLNSGVEAAAGRGEGTRGLQLVFGVHGDCASAVGGVLEFEHLRVRAGNDEGSNRFDLVTDKSKSMLEGK